MDTLASTSYSLASSSSHCAAHTKSHGGSSSSTKVTVPVPQIQVLVSAPSTSSPPEFRFAAAAENPHANTHGFPQLFLHSNPASRRASAASLHDLNHMIVDPAVVDTETVEAQDEVRADWCALDYMIRMWWGPIGGRIAAETVEVGCGIAA
ncbi:hypothetical protein BDK51DRAFT_33689 [Blyttiomyces helicus]|uniref:Uncharacterized protein n=1 Tax=Blyttiomyces helicus TaxID=388810 RepID=A0A4P9W5D2_9FUNG|nr:hypothetical protein BDK51DRAFT_33689 [Blyttiomyces helicus]|eukprot:RKO85306.1 hypothetical protein BDK51DRAFT_33689 [Blyttiomyces helicus]